MKGKLNLHIIATGTFIVFIVLGLACASSSTPAGEAAYYQPPSKPALSSQQREKLTEADIDLLILKGDDAYEDGQYSVAQDYYYQALLAMPNPSDYVLVSYGACLANLQSYENAITMFNLALEKNPGNGVAKENIRICRQLIAAQTEEQRRLEQVQERQQRENFNNLVTSINSLSTVVGNLQSPQSQSGGADGVAGGQGQTVTSGNSSSSGRDKKNNFDISAAKSKYDRYERNAKSAWDNVKSSGDISAQQRRTFQECQAGMRKTREEAERNGYKDIRKSKWEDERLP
jgi:tetratricopeptide (TPR) repeat protein